MYSLLLTLLVIDAFLLITVVLLQAGKGGGLAGLGGGMAGTENLFGSRQAANLLTRASWWTGGIFLVLTLALSGLSTGRAASRESILRQSGTTGAAPVAPAAPTLPSVAQPPAAPGATQPASGARPNGATDVPAGPAGTGTPATPAPSTPAPGTPAP